MASNVKLYIILAIICPSIAQGGFGNILNNIEKCEDTCNLSYPPHTYPNGSELDACTRGCRFYSIASLIRPFGIDVDVSESDVPSRVKQLCYDSCVESYNKTSPHTIACKTGCDGQELSEKEQQTKTENGDLAVHSVEPIMQVREVLSSFQGAFHIVRTSLLTYFLQDDDTVVAVQSNPEVMIEMMPKQASDENNNNDDDLQSIAGLNFEPRSSNDYIKEPVAYQSFTDIPGFLLVAAVVPILIFVTFYTMGMFTRNNRKRVLEGQLISGKEAGPLPVKLVRPEDLTKLTLMEDDDTQAPPLPTKVKLPDSVI